MQGDKHSKVPFDDRAALEELERLQKSIQAYRHQRAQAEGAFEEFVGGFRQSVGESAGADVPAAGVAPAAAVPITAAAAEYDVAAPSFQPDDTLEGLPAPFPERFPAELPSAPAGSLFSDEPEAAAPAALFTDPKPSRGRLPLILGIILAMIVGFVVTARFRQASLQPAPVAVQQTPAPAVQPVLPSTEPRASDLPPSSASTGESAPPAAGLPGSAAPSPQPPPTTAAGTASPSSSASGPPAPAEIRTVRRAWVRVLVDGRREVEREVEANARVPLPAGTTYVVRAGDAGAVHFFLKGQDLGPLGADAQVVTRTFPSSAR